MRACGVRAYGPKDMRTYIIINMGRLRRVGRRPKRYENISIWDACGVRAAGPKDTRTCDQKKVMCIINSFCECVRESQSDGWSRIN